MPYIGKTELDSAILKEEFVAAASQTTFSTIYDPGTVDVYLDGILLINGIGYTATNGSDIILATPATGGETVSVRTILSVTVNDTVSASSGGQFAAQVDFNGGLYLPDNQKILIGSGNTETGDLQLYHDGANSYIRDTGQGSLRIPAAHFDVRNVDDTGFMIRAINAGAVELYYNTNRKMYTTDAGLVIEGDIDSLSDASLKENVEDIQNPIEIVKSLSGKEFTWKTSGRKSAGVIAQEIEQILPHLVQEDDAGIKSVNYLGVIAYLIEAIKELDSKIN